MKVTVKAEINIPKCLKKVENKQFWEFAANECRRLMARYVPKDSGALEQSVRIRADTMTAEIEYFQPYAHYQNEGEAMGPSFYSPDYGFWSPPGKKKSYTGKKLHYKTPGTGAHWERQAAKNDKDKLIEAMQGYLDRSAK